MDIDAARKTKAAPDTCRRCRKTGHWAKECDLRFNVRYMDTDELERELENKFAAKDVASAEPPVELIRKVGAPFSLLIPPFSALCS